ncbi:MAG: bifunctional UDP-N-acetylglucosamine diphosphorylase/glucosamine-1-phosphate N-acetyltransferase GlmU [Terriglobales bacterium]
MPKAKSNSPQPALRLAIAIMAAGKGTRLKSKHPKVLHEVGGKPLLAHVIAAAAQVAPEKDIYAIIGHEAEQVRQAVAHTGVKFVEQKPQKGTGHALMVARDVLSAYEQVIVLSGDAPLITPATITHLRDFHAAKRAAMTILTARLAEPAGYGRVVRRNSKSDEVQAIVEDKAVTPAQKKIREINSGIYAFAVAPLLRYIDKLAADNAHAEFYLTDMAAILRKAKERVVAVAVADTHEVLGGNTRAELVEIDQHIRLAKCQQLMRDGVTIFYPHTCVIDADVEIGADSVIEPFVQILGNSRIGGDCRIRSYSVIRNTVIEDDVVVLPGCVMDDSQVKRGAVIGPYSRLRPGSEIGEGAHVGNFVETKKTRLGKGSKANHLSYLGNAEIGEGVNVGAGTITCNYDGVHKHTTVIEDNVFVGSDTTLVAPVRVAKGAYIGAGSCITDDVPEDSLAIGRARQIVKAGWMKQKREPAKAGKP